MDRCLAVMRIYTGSRATTPLAEQADRARVRPKYLINHYNRLTTTQLRSNFPGWSQSDEYVCPAFRPLSSFSRPDATFCGRAAAAAAWPGRAIRRGTAGNRRAICRHRRAGWLPHPRAPPAHEPVAGHDPQRDGRPDGVSDCCSPRTPPPAGFRPTKGCGCSSTGC